MSEDARGEWGGLAAKPPRCELDLPGAEILSESTHLDEAEGGGAMTWSVERVYKTGSGLFVLTRLARSTDDEGERATWVAGADPSALVAEVRAQLGMTPGLVEVLGRAGIEIGLEPDDEIQD